MGLAPRSLHLIVPGLSGPVSPEFPAPEGFDTLRHWLSRARHQHLTYQTVDELLAARFALPRSGNDLPVAPLCYQWEGTGDPHAAYILRADPVSLTPGLHSLVLSNGEQLQLTAEEVAEVIALLNSHFGEQGWRFEAPHPERWYLILPEVAQISTTPYAGVYERTVEGQLPRGPEAAAWHAWLLELQMLLHQWPANQQRQLDNRPQLNSVWFWGGGTLPPPPQTPLPWRAVWADEAFTCALAQWHGLPSQAQPEDAAQWLAEAGPGEHLLRLTAPVVAVWDEVYPRWLDYLQGDWLGPLVAALQQGQLQTLIIETPHHRFELDRRRLRRWWHRRQSLSRWLEIRHD